MTRDVLISIAGLQFEYDRESSDEPIELICHGNYSFDNNIHTVRYDDISEDEDGSTVTTKCVITFNSLKLELVKKGDINTELVFEEGKNHTRFYSTEYGDFCIGINTSLIDIKETAEQIDILLRYDLDFNYQRVSECTLTIKITSLKPCP